MREEGEERGESEGRARGRESSQLPLETIPASRSCTQRSSECKESCTSCGHGAPRPSSSLLRGKDTSMSPRPDTEKIPRFITALKDTGTTENLCLPS